MPMSNSGATSEASSHAPFTPSSPRGRVFRPQVFGQLEKSEEDQEDRPGACEAHSVELIGGHQQPECDNQQHRAANRLEQIRLPVIVHLGVHRSLGSTFDLLPEELPASRTYSM